MTLETCAECGKEVSGYAKKCPNCGFTSGKYVGKSKGLAIALALLLGGLGAHKFYLGKPWLGFLYLIFFWTYIPAILGLIDAVVLATKKEREFSGAVIPAKAPKNASEKKSSALGIQSMREDLRSALERDGVKADQLSHQSFRDIEKHLPVDSKVLFAHDMGRHLLLNTGILILKPKSTSNKAAGYDGADLIPFNSLAKVSTKSSKDFGVVIHKNDSDSTVLDFTTSDNKNAREFAETLFSLIPVSARKGNLREDYALANGYGPDYVPDELDIARESYIPKDSKILCYLGKGSPFFLLDNGVLKIKFKLAGGPYGGAEFVPLSQIRGVTIKDRNPGFAVEVRREEGAYVIAGSSFKASDFYGLTDSQEEAIKFQELLLGLLKGSSTPQNSSDGPLEKIAKLKQLLDSGAISQAEFDEKKKPLMDSI